MERGLSIDLRRLSGKTYVTLLIIAIIISRVGSFALDTGV